MINTYNLTGFSGRNSLLNCPICGNSVHSHEDHFKTTKRPITYYYCNVCRLDFQMVDGVLYVIPKYPKTRLEDFAV
jgi:hypothetical protein